MTQRSTTEAQADVHQQPQLAKVAFASLIGTAIEWYDFFLYGTAAALVFPKLFFPKFDPLVGTLLAFSTYTIGFIARPIAGVVFGHFGDRIGRKQMLFITLLFMGISSTLIGVLPTYAQVGIWAPILLTLMRVCQGIGLGGEWGGAVLMAVEHAPAAGAASSVPSHRQALCLAACYRSWRSGWPTRCSLNPYSSPGVGACRSCSALCWSSSASGFGWPSPSHLPSKKSRTRRLRSNAGDSGH